MTSPINALVLAIYLAEGGSHTRYPYGIMSVHTQNPRNVCVLTIEHALKDYPSHVIDLNFINFLSTRYCPPSIDKTGNKHWRHNVTKIYEKEIQILPLLVQR